MKPLYEVLVNFMPKLGDYISNFESNKSKWSNRVNEFEEKLSMMRFNRIVSKTEMMI